MGKHVNWGGALCLAIAACSGTALAGPDVIVGDLTGPSNYGADTGYVVYAIGTTSCNKGDAPLSWISSTPAHPVISQNMYRLYNGRFEQLGQAWLKHGFTALQGNVCNFGCNANPNGSALGVGCSDPYGSSLNGSQGPLGAKYQVNATTGVFPYPPDTGSGSGTKFKRLQVLDTKLDPANGMYFVACMYVAADDAASGNKHNNESYRQVNVASGSKAISFAAPTQREKPAIQAWQDNDPGVVLTNIDDPDTGRFIVGCRVTGSGPYHYEYAVQNLNSDRSGGSFSVSIPSNANVTNVGFSDVDYHSGEPYTGTDWTNAVSSTEVTWSSTQTYAQNQNANALRWDTIYNFWFDCDIPPAAGTATIGLFKPGALTSIAGATLTPSADGVPGPINNSCSLPTVVSDASTPFDTTNATTDGPNECTFSNYSQVGSDIWFLWTNGPCDGDAVISTCGSSFDTKIAVYSGSSCPTLDGTALACNDDEGSTGSCSGTLQSAVSVTMNAGETYYIRVTGYNGNSGTYNLLVTGGGGTVTNPPTNDDCSGRIGIPLGALEFSTQDATTDGPTESCGTATNDVWYNHPQLGTGTLTVSTCDAMTNFDTIISVYENPSCIDFASRLLACNDDACGLQSSVTIPVQDGQHYVIRIGGFNGASGHGILHLDFTPAPTCVADVDNGTGTGTPDGGVTVDDLLYYLSIYGQGALAADVDDGSGTGTTDGGVTVDDLLYYLTRFNAGC